MSPAKFSRSLLLRLVGLLLSGFVPIEIHPPLIGLLVHADPYLSVNKQTQTVDGLADVEWLYKKENNTMDAAGGFKGLLFAEIDDPPGLVFYQHKDGKTEAHNDDPFPIYPKS